MHSSHQLTVIMFTDIVGYTSLMGRDENMAIKILRANREIHKRIISKYSGVYLKEMGDGCMAKFQSASNAAYCAGEIMEELKKAFPDQNLKIGIHLGDVVEENGDIFGDGVNIAARIESSAKPGQILVSNPVYENLINKNGIDGNLVGPLKLKNVENPVIIHEIIVDSYPDLTSGLAFNQGSKKGLSKIFKSKRTLLTMAIAAFILVSVFVSNLFLLNSNNKTKKNETIDDKLAVLHFDNLTGDEELAVVGPMISNWITEGFIQNGDVKVVSNNSIQRAYASISKIDDSQKAKAKLIGELGTRNVIEGSYFLQNDSIYIKSDLVNVNTGDITYSFGTFVGDKSEPIPIIEDLQQSVLGYWYNKENLQRFPAPKFNSYKKYIEAILLWGEDGEKTHQLLDESIKLDPNFNEPLFLHIAKYRNDQEWEICDSLIQILDSKKTELTKAQMEKLRFFKYELEGDYSTAYKYLLSEYKRDESDLFMNSSVANFAMFKLNDHEEVLKISSLIDLDKIEFEDCHYCKYRLYVLSTAHLKAGRYEEALKICSYNPKLDPDFRVQKVEVLSHLRLGNFHVLDSLVTAMERKNSDGRNLLIANILSVESNIINNEEEAMQWDNHAEKIYKYKSLDNLYAVEEYAISCVRREAYNKAIDIYGQLAQKYPDKLYYQYKLASTYILAGKETQADKIIEELKKLRIPHDFGSLDYELAIFAALRGETEEALQYLNSALADGRQFKLSFFDRDWFLQSLWELPEFKKLLAKRHVSSDI